MIAALLLGMLLAQAQPLRLVLAQAQPEREPGSAVEAMNRARSTFESATLRAEAYRLLGLSLFYQGRKGEAYSAFLEYLYLDPDAELDPFYVPPAAVSFFDQVKREAEPRLAPIRAQKRAEQEARRRAAAEEAERRRQREAEAERERLLQLQPQIEHRVVQHEFWVTLMPFGLGQLQNGDRKLGIALATAQLVAGAASAGSALLIEQLRDQTTGKFNSVGPGNAYHTAQNLNIVKWVGAGVFYALWAGGAIHAAIRYRPEEQLPDRLVR
jgi:hypothetical protein